MKRLPEVTVGLFLVAMLVVCACTTTPPVTTQRVVYISDFELEAAQIQQSGSGVPSPPPLSQRLGYGRPKIEPTPEQRVRALVDLMSRSLLEDLRKAGIPAQRLPPGAPLPSSGLLIRGAFLGVDAGGKLRRPVEFGAGSTQAVLATIEQLGAGTPQPLYTVDSTAPSGKSPGAVVAPNPNIGLGRYVLTPREPERNVTQVAEDIVEQVKLRMGISTSDNAAME